MTPRTVVTALAALAVAGIGLVPPADAALPASTTGPATSSASAPTSAPTSAPATTGSQTHRATLRVGTKTRFGLTASGFGTNVSGGQIPAGSGSTAFNSTGCTTRTGVQRGNTEADVDLGGQGTVAAVDTDVHTEKVNGQIAAVSHHRVVGVSLDLGGGASLGISAVESTARAYHDARGFHTETSYKIGDITVAGNGITTQLPLPTTEQPIDIPGLATITLGKTYIKKTASFATAVSRGLQIDIAATGTRVRIAASRAMIEDGVTQGRFGGSSNSTRIEVAGTLLTSGATLKSIMKCAGTQGKTLTTAAVGTTLGPIVIGAAENQQQGTQGARKAFGFEQAKVAGVDIGGGQLVVKGIVGRVNVVRRGSTLKANTNGSTILSITAGGQEQAIPDPGQSLEIPGVAKIAPFVEEKYAGGKHIIALQITLLDGSGAVINIGEAKLRIRQP